MQPNQENSKTKLAAKGCGKAAPWKSPKNGLSHLAWKSAHPADFHFPHSLCCYWDMNGSLSNEDDRKTHIRPRPRLTYCSEKMVLTLGSTLLDGEWNLSPLDRGRRVGRINTEKLLRFKDKYQLLIVARINDTGVNWLTDPNIQKSNAITIESVGGTIKITVPFSQPFLHYAQLFGQNDAHFNFSLCLIPHNINPDVITKLEDVQTRGGHVFQPARGGGAALGPAVSAPN